MVDPADIQTRYGAMSDEELTHFVKEEGDSLTETAFDLLKAEFARRNLHVDLINHIQDGSHKEEQAVIERIIKTVPEQGDRTALSIALNEKRDGENNEAIVYHLMDMGLDQESARIVTEQIKPEAEMLQGKARTMMLTSMFALCAGCALYLVSPYKPVVTFLDILSTCTVVFAAFRLLLGFIEFKKFKSILIQIDKEQGAGQEQIEIRDIN